MKTVEQRIKDMLGEQAFTIAVLTHQLEEKETQAKPESTPKSK